MILTDTILAISSPPNGGVRGIVRLSGPDAWQLAATIITLPSPPTIGWHANLVLPLLHPTAKLAAALLFQAPRSFTGQDIAELHLPNSPALLKSILAQLLENAAAENIPARLADPGEFSARAFFHGKIDLTQAEGIAATINAANESQLRAAASLRAGDLHHWSAAAAENIAAILALVEAGIDFVEEEDIHFFDPSKVHLQLAALAREIRERLENSTRIDRLDALPTVVFIGKPNVGKSSLINALTGHDRSIVSPIAGTTRDMLAATLHTPAGAIRLLDVPGEESPTDELRQKMMAARENALLDADLIIEVVTAPNDALRPLAEDAQYAAPRVVARNKADLLPPSRLPTRPTAPYPGEDSAKHDEWHLVSAHTSYGISELRAAIAQRIAHHEPLGAHNIVLNHRHRAILHETRLALLDAAEIARGDAAHQHPELLAAELRRALDILGQMTGAISPDDVLGRIFSHFCIGK